MPDEPEITIPSQPATDHVSFISRWHIVIGGRGQHTGENTGNLTLFQIMHRKFSGPGTQVLYAQWNADFDDLADHIRWCSGLPPETHITIASYSWGVTGARNLSEALRKRGYLVQSITCSDGVYRHWYVFGQWRALVRSWKITMPRNVQSVTYFVQRNDIPQGHEIVAMPGCVTPVIVGPIILDRTHNYMDESWEFHEAAVLAASANSTI